MGGHMSDLKYTLVIESRKEPEPCVFYSLELEEVRGRGESVTDCVVRGRRAMEKYVARCKEQGLPLPAEAKGAKLIIENLIPR